MAQAVGWKMRTGLVVSAVWLCLTFLVSDDHQKLIQVLGLGVLPLVIIWGIVWAVSGWRAQRSTVRQVNQADQAARSTSRKALVRTTIALIVVFTLGLVAVNLQFKLAGDEAGANGIAYWFGQGLVYGILAYIILRLTPKLPIGAAAVLAALVIVGSINWQAYTAIAERRQAVASLARATPFINKILAGTTVTDEEVRNGKIGELEPLILAQAAYGREVASITSKQEKTLEDLALEKLLTPATLASANGRFQARATVRLWQQTIAEYKSQMDAASARGKAGVKAALTQTPQPYVSGARDGAERSARVMAEYVDKEVLSANESIKAISTVLDLLDANPNSFMLDKGPHPNLLFRDNQVLAIYQGQVEALVNAERQDQENRRRLLQEQTSRSERINEFLSK